MQLPITCFFAAIFTLLYVGMSLWVIQFRRTNKISLGDGDHLGLRKAISTHGNFSQYIPLAMIIMTLSELNVMPKSGLILFGSSMLLGRIFHIIGVGIIQKPGTNRFREVGMVLTFTSLSTSSIWLLLHLL